jgi:hypothetical protein
MSETYPPEGDQGLGARPPETGEMLEPNMQEPLGKPKLHWGFALLGLAATGLLSWGIAIGASAIGSTLASDTAYNVIGPVAVLLEVALFAGMMFAWIRGRRHDENRLRSFGLGGLIAYLAMMLLSLLAVGACFVSLGTGGSLFGN